MKNIHVLPTDKPSRLYLFEERLILGDLVTVVFKNSGAVNQNIYITNDEEIKEGDWFLWQGYGGEWFKEKCEYMLYEGKKTKHLNCHYKTQFKVILTDNKDLIADGVQAIDDEFLEWFVKNPSCESVRVNNLCYGALGGFADAGYKIIIPKEEPNPFELPKALPDDVFYQSLEEPKQETLEEASHTAWLNYEHVEGDLYYTSFKNGFIDGAKSDAARDYWFEKFQQEQGKNKYSEDEVLEQLNHLMTMRSSKLDKFTDDNGNITMKWFSQFKKK